MPNNVRTQWCHGIVVTVGLAAAAVVVPCAIVAAAPPPPGSGHAEVVAQGLLQLDGGDMQWSASTLDIAAVTTLSSDRPTFVAAGGGSALVLEGSDGIDAVLDAGEAVFRPAAATSDSSALGVDPSHIAVLGVGSPGGDGAVGDPFVPGAGAHDVELLHDTLAPGETLTVGGALPVLLFVAGGAVTARADGAASDAGALEVVPGDAPITNATDTPASVFVGVVGPVIDLTAPTTTTTTVVVTITTVPAAATTTPATTSATTPATTPATTAPPATTTPTTPPATAPPTTLAAPSTTAAPPPPTTPLDSDSDGLSNSDEEAYGTNPGVYDTDGDGLGDGDEVFVYGTNPTDSDTNDNGILDPG